MDYCSIIYGIIIPTDELILNMNGLFVHIWEIIIPTDELHHFSEGWVNHQPGKKLDCGYH
jgi:hypothetical protein